MKMQTAYLFFKLEANSVLEYKYFHYCFDSFIQQKIIVLSLISKMVLCYIFPLSTCPRESSV